MNTQKTRPWKDRQQWLRLVFMLLYAVVLNLTMWVLAVVVLVQVAFKLVAGHTQSGVGNFAADLNRFISQIVRFLTYQSDTRPFPFNPLTESPPTTDDDVFTADETVVETDNNQHSPR